MSLRDILLSKRGKLSLESGLSTGSTLLNLACTSDPKVGLLKGGYYFLVGDSASGKTWFSLSCLAEAARNKAYDDYRLIYDDVEGGALMDMEKFFGKKLANRIEPPAIRKGKYPVNSTTVESFYYHITDVLQQDAPFIYILDSQDALTSEAAKEKFAEQKKAFENGKEAAGSYGDGKAKYHSEHLREILAGIRKRKSILLIIGQTRDNLGMGYEKKTRSGGKSLRFYANLEIWTSVKDKIKHKVNGNDRSIGVNVMAEVRKNRVTGKVGKDWGITIPIYHSFGMDDVGSCIDFLIGEQHWTKEKDGNRTVYNAKDIMFQGSREQIVRYIEDEDLEDKLREVTSKVWKDIELACSLQRKARYE